MNYSKLKDCKAKALCFLLILIGINSCKPTKYLGEGAHLLTENKVELQNYSTTDAGFESSDLEGLIRPKPNSKLLGYRLYARLYNLASEERAEKVSKRKNKKCEKKKIKKIDKLQTKILKYEGLRKNLPKNDRKYIRYTKKIAEKEDAKLAIKQSPCKHKHWTRNIGEAPVVYKTNDRFRTLRQMRIFLKNKGYYNATITDSVNFDDYFKVKRKKFFNKNYKSPYAKVIYQVNPGHPYRISKLKYNAPDTVMLAFLLHDSTNTHLKIGKRLDTELFQEERLRIETTFRSKGYYKFSKEYISYNVDTLGGNHTVQVTLILSNPADIKGVSQRHRQFKLNKIFIFTNFQPKPALTNKEAYFNSMDTTLYLFEKKYSFLFLNNSRQILNNKAVARGTYLFSDSLFNFNNVQATYRYLSSLKIIKIANINFKDAENQTDSLNFGLLDCELRLTPSALQSFQTEVTGTNTSGNIGAAANFIYQHKNLFHNGEVLDLNLKLALERQTGASNTNLIDNAQKFFNSSETGLEMGLHFPRLLSPILLRSFNRRVTPNTNISLAYNNLQRPDYTRTIAGMSFGYTWNSSSTVRHFFQPISFDLINLKNPSEDFLNYIKAYRLGESYEDHLIWGTSYSITINNQVLKEKRNPSYIRLNFKSAGLFLQNAMKLTRQDKVNGNYVLLGNIFSQFVKSDIDYRFYKKLDRFKDKLVFRTFAGAVLPYGNSKSVPFGEKYFSGGANGIRAWQVRTVGPGAYELPDSSNVFPNQTADIKLEANFEYRFKLFWTAEGALFVDAGNIWAINSADDREGAQFQLSSFYKQIAVGTGFGLRLDFDFFIIRTDFGFKIREPYTTKGKYWIPGNRKYYTKDWTFNVGIGYPF